MLQHVQTHRDLSRYTLVGRLTRAKTCYCFLIIGTTAASSAYPIAVCNDRVGRNKSKMFSPRAIG